MPQVIAPPKGIGVFDLVLETMGLEGELDMAGLAVAAAPLLRAMDHAKGIAPSAERHQRDQPAEQHERVPQGATEDHPLTLGTRRRTGPTAR